MNSPLWLYANEVEDLPIGSIVLTPANRMATVIKHRTGASKKDCLTRVTLRYVGGHPKDMFTLQPQLLRIIPESKTIDVFEAAAQLMQGVGK